jgi:hypothetical protein
MAGKFPQLQSMLQKRGRVGAGVQQANPLGYQVMPQMPDQTTWPTNLTPQEAGMERQAGFNKEQEEANKGLIGGSLNRRRY